MKYILLRYEIRSGEHECDHVTILEVEDGNALDIEDAVEEYMSDFYGEYTVKDSDGFWRSDMCEVARIRGWKEISKAEYDILRKHNI